MTLVRADSESSSVPTSTSTTTAGTFPDSGEVDLDIPYQPCDNPDFQCSLPMDCMQWNCGSLESPFDEKGCLRPACENDYDCFGDICFRPLDWGYCVSSGTLCRDGPSGTCECTSDPDCAASHCIPAHQAPPSTCEFDDPDACASAGCRTLQGRLVPPAGPDWVCEPEADSCVWWPEDKSVRNTVTLYMNWLTGEVVAFRLRVDPAPLGWAPCDEVPFPPPECACTDDLLCTNG